MEFNKTNHRLLLQDVLHAVNRSETLDEAKELVTGCLLAEIDALNREIQNIQTELGDKEILLVAPSGTRGFINPGDYATVLSHVKDNKKIAGIKFLLSVLGFGLKDTKELYEKIQMEYEARGQDSPD